LRALLNVDADLPRHLLKRILHPMPGIKIRPSHD